MALLFCLVAMCVVFMGGIALSPEMDGANRAIALVIFLTLLIWTGAFALGLRRALLGPWLVNRRWRDYRPELSAIEPRDATPPEILETERLPVHVLSPAVLGVKRGGGIDHVAVGAIREQEVRVLNVRVRGGGWFDVPAVAIHVDAAMAPTMICPVKGRLRLPPRPGMHSILLESEQFNRSFGVFSADAYFATAMLDARMMRWLMERSDRCVIELSDRWAFAWALPRTGKHIHPTHLIEILEEFDEHVPRAVPSLFPKTDRRLLWRTETS
jgi:hypothetical protein